MKNQVMPSAVQMERELFNKLVAEVKETVAKGFVMPRTGKRQFGVVDMWQIQKKRKYTGEYLTIR